jgi:hypothetical protein
MTMKLVKTLVVMPVAGLFVFGAQQAGNATPSRLATHTVSIHVSCATREASLTPDSIEISRNDTVEWELDATSDDVEFSIHKKHPLSNWPFKNNPHQGRKGARARADQMESTPAQRNEYKVKLNCPGKDVVIDPIIIVRGS